MKYISLEHTDGTVRAFSEEEFDASILNEAHCWIWQEANSRAEAIDSHLEKYTGWEDGLEAEGEDDPVQKLDAELLNLMLSVSKFTDGKGTLDDLREAQLRAEKFRSFTAY